MRQIVSVSLLVAIAALAVVVRSPAATSSPVTLTVNNTAMGGPMTLSHAISSAAGSPNPVIINFDPAIFPPGAPATINVTGEGFPDIDDTNGITIDGTGAGVIIDGSGAEESADGLLFDSPTDDAGPVVVRNITVQNFPGDGLLLFNDGDVESLTMDRLAVVDNAGSGFNGLVDGTIGTTTITDSEFSRNGDDGIYLGPRGAMDMTTVTSTIANGNAGSGLVIYPDFATTSVNVTDSTFNANTRLGLDIDATPLVNVSVSGVTANDNDGSGISLHSTEAITGASIMGSRALDNVRSGLSVSAPTVNGAEFIDNTFERNLTGITLAGTGTTGANLMKQNTVRDNTLDGVRVDASFTETYERWTISQNITSGNGELGIDLVSLTPSDSPPGVTPNDDGDTDSGPNTLLNWPEFATASGSDGSISGVACTGCTVEVFQAAPGSTGFGEGERYLGSATANGSGEFTFELCGLALDDEITATATDSQGNTSEFGQNYVVDEAIPACVALNGDLDCDGDVDGRDALIAFVHHAGATQLSREAGCPEIGSSTAVSSGQTPAFFGDVNCTSVVDHVDGFAILRYIAGVLYDAEPVGVCTRIGDPL